MASTFYLPAIKNILNSWSAHTVIGESMSAGRIYDKIGDTAKAKVVLVTPHGTICSLSKKSLIDTSPSLGTLNINVMEVSDEVIVTVNPQLLAMKGLQDFLKTVKEFKSRINENLDVAGLLLTMCDARTILCKTITEQFTETFNGQIRIFKSKIPNTVKIGESVYYSESLIEYAPGFNECIAYERLVGEMIA